MSEPIPDAAAGGIPDLAAAAALVHLITLLHTDPLGRPLLEDGQYGAAWFRVTRGTLHVLFNDPDSGAQQLAAARALFGGTVEEKDRSYRHEIEHTLTTVWRGVPLSVQVSTRREDEIADLRKQVAELRQREGALLEQRHQLLDPAVPPLPMSGAAVAE